MNVVNQFCTHCEAIIDQKVVEKVLRILPQMFDMVVTTIEETKKLAQSSIEELMDFSLNHESRINPQGK